MPDIFGSLCNCVGTCGDKLFDPTKHSDPNVILHFHTDQGLWGCQDACNRTTDCKFYTHSSLSNFKESLSEKAKYAEIHDSPVFRCILWRNCDKFFIPFDDQWMHLRSGPKDCYSYTQTCPIVYGEGKALATSSPAGYTKTSGPCTVGVGWGGACGFKVREWFKNLSHGIRPIKGYHH